MTAYVMFRCLQGPDPADFEKYRAAVRETLIPYEVKILSLHPSFKQVEREVPTHSLALLEFADMASATAWYESPEYQKIIPFRTNSGTYEAFIFEGFPPRPAMA